MEITNEMGAILKTLALYKSISVNSLEELLSLVEYENTIVHCIDINKSYINSTGKSESIDDWAELTNHLEYGSLIAVGDNNEPFKDQTDLETKMDSSHEGRAMDVTEKNVL